MEKTMDENGSVLFGSTNNRRFGERRIGERRTDDDSGAWKIVCAIWNKFGLRRSTETRRTDYMPRFWALVRRSTEM